MVRLYSLFGERLHKATDVFNEQYKVEDEKQTDFDNLSDDELIKQMQELERQIEKRKKQKDFEMKFYKICHTSIDFEKLYDKMLKKVEEVFYFSNLLHFKRRFDII